MITTCSLLPLAPPPNPFAFHIQEPIHPFPENPSLCFLDPQRIIAIRNNFVDFPTPIEGECIGFEARETLIDKLMRGIRKAMGLAKTIFGNKYDAQEHMRTLMQDLLHLQKPLFPRTIPLKVPVSIPPDALQQLREPLVAVRSSCQNEDEAHNLKAGMFRTLFVPREITRVAKAALEVVASCDTPSFGTFAQEYIGEIGDEVPIAAGHISGTPSITTAAFGQGKGVVEGGVAVHTFHCIPSAVKSGLYCHAHTPKIPERWTLSAEGNVTKVSNPDFLATTPTLSEKHLEEIHRIASFAKAFFECPVVNLEFVLREGGIYALQFRCISQLQVTPTYLDADLPHAVPIEVYTPGNLSVTILHSPEELITSPTLKEAYLHLTPASIAAAVSEPETSAISHPIASFKSLGMPTFQTDLTALAQLRFPLGFCPQTRRIFHWEPALKEHIRSGSLLFPGTLSSDSPYPLEPSLPIGPDLFEVLVSESKKVLGWRIFLRPIPSLDSYLQRFFTTLTSALKELLALSSTDPRRPFIGKVLYETLREAPPIYSLLKYQSLHPSLVDLIPLAGKNPKILAHWEMVLRTFANHADTIRSFVAFLEEFDAFRNWLFLFPPTSLSDFFVAPEEVQFLRALPLQADLPSKVAFFISPSFIKSFRGLSPIGRFIALRRMRLLVDDFDRKLKKIQVQRNIPQFQKTLSSFFSLLQNWQYLIPQEMWMHNSSNSYLILQTLELLIKANPPSSDALDVHPDFDSSQVLLLPSQMNSGTPPRRLPTNLLDAFTATHQILINDVIGSCVAQLFSPSSSLLPEELQQLLEKLTPLSLHQKGLLQARAVLVSVENSDRAIDLVYNIPLHNHSATMKLRFDSGLYTLSLFFYNIDIRRAQELTDWIKLLHQYEFPRVKFSSGQDQFFCEVTTERGLETLDLYLAALQYTMDLDLISLFSQIQSPLLEQHLVQHLREFAKKHLQSPSFQEKTAGLGLLEAIARKGHTTDAIQYLKGNLFTIETVKPEPSEAWNDRFRFHQATMQMLFSLIKLGHAHDFAHTVIQRWKGHREFWFEAMQLEDLLKK